MLEWQDAKIHKPKDGERLLIVRTNYIEKAEYVECIDGFNVQWIQVLRSKVKYWARYNLPEDIINQEESL